MHLDAAIEKNRHALLRIVACWLLLAQCLAFSKDRYLPRRLARLVSNLISKVETATRLLVVARAYRLQHEMGVPICSGSRRQGLIYPVPAVTYITLHDIIRRLRQIRLTLVTLKECATKLCAKLSARHAVIAHIDGQDRSQILNSKITILGVALLYSQSVMQIIPP